MDNREFAELLLSEAVDLLNEATTHGSRQKFLELDGTTQNKIGEDIHNINKRLSAEPDKVRLHGKSSLKSKIDIARMKHDKKGLVNEYDKLGKEAQKYSVRVGSKNVSVSTDDYETMHGPNVNFKKDRKAKEKFMEDFGSAKPKNYKLHQRINAKVQNESIAILLTEAALLLNDED